MTFFDQIAKLITQHLEATAKKGDADAYTNFSNTIEGMKKDCRDCLKEITHEKLDAIIKRLRRGQVLASEDIQLIRLWIIGDAEAHVKAQENYQDRLEEVIRLHKDIEELRSQQVNVYSVARLRALLTELDRTVQDVVVYLEDRERIQHFESAIKTVDTDEAERKLLADLLTRSLELESF